MAIAQKFDDDVLNSIIKRSLISTAPKEKTEVLTEKNVVKVSNTITSLQNAFNKIYAYTQNVKNIHKLEEKRLQNIKKEVTMETKTSTATFAGGMSIEVGNLPDVFKQLTESVEELTKNLDKLDMSSQSCDVSSGTTDIDDDDDDFDRRRRRRGGRRGGGRGRGRGRGGRGGRGTTTPRTRGRLGFGGRFLLGIGFDLGAGAFGVGQGLDEEAIAAQDDLNWQRATTLEKIQSSIPRGIEMVGNLFGLSNISAQARADRVKSETEYLERTRPRQTGATRQLEQATANVTRQQTRLQIGQPLGSTSFSSRFANYIDQSVTNMAQWAMAASPLMAAALSGAGFFGGVISDYLSPDAAGSSANAETAIAFFMSAAGGGWTRAQAAGIVGNLQGESGAGLDPNAFRANDAGPGLHSYGIAQWNRERYAGLQAYASRAGKPWNDFQTQLGYVQHELSTTERAVGEALRGAQDAAAAAVVMSRYERYRGYQLGIASPETRKRMANANALMGAGTVAGGSVNRRGGGVGTVSSRFGMRPGGMHKGIDIAAPAGTPVAAAADGRIVRAEFSTSYGNVIYIDHAQGQSTRYAHLNAFAPGIRNGIQVKAGDIIGGVGNTGQSRGNHLHYELLINGAQVDPLGSYQERPWIVGGTRNVPAPAPAPRPRQPPPSPTIGQRLDNAINAVTEFFGFGDDAPPARTPNTGGAAFRDAQTRR